LNNERSITCFGLERAEEELVVAYFKVQSLQPPGGSEKTTKNSECIGRDLNRVPSEYRHFRNANS
jgi:hypothetical protein